MSCDSVILGLVNELRWNLSELADESSRFLDEGDSKRIRWQPNGRQIRYYTTLGLLDRPFGGRGQKVSYGPKHLLQLLAIKRLQHQGLKLAEIQPVMAGLSQERLAELLGLPQNWLDHLDTAAPAEEPLPDRHQTAFWAAPPTPPQRATPEIKTCLQVEIEPGVILTIDQSQATHLPPEALEDLTADIRRIWRQRR